MRRLLFVTLIIVMAALTACAPAAAPTAAPTTAPTKAPAAAGLQLPVVDVLKVKGNITTAGSSTVFPLSEKIAEMFKDEGYKDNITIDSIGTGAGFERFCKTAETDIANASRAIKTEEADACKAKDRQPLEFRVGADALAVVVSKQNTFLKNVTMKELAKIYSSDAEKWSDVNPAWPAETILRFSPGTDSGTFDYFVEVVLGKKKEILLGAKNLQLSEDDNVLVKGVLGSPYAIGYFGYAYYQENKDKLNVLSIEGIEPTTATVDAAKYPLARPLFLYSTAKIMKEKPQVGSFISYYLTNVNTVISKVGYFPASQQALDGAKRTWQEATQ